MSYPTSNRLKTIMSSWSLPSSLSDMVQEHHLATMYLISSKSFKVSWQLRACANVTFLAATTVSAILRHSNCYLMSMTLAKFSSRALMWTARCRADTRNSWGCILQAGLRQCPLHKSKLLAVMAFRDLPSVSETLIESIKILDLMLCLTVSTQYPSQYSTTMISRMIAVTMDVHTFQRFTTLLKTIRRYSVLTTGW